MSLEYECLFFCINRLMLWLELDRIVEFYVAYEKIVEYYDNGIKKCEYMVFGERLHGNFYSWHDNGVLAEHTKFMYGLEHGEHKWWDSNGKLRMRINYRII